MIELPARWPMPATACNQLVAPPSWPLSCNSPPLRRRSEGPPATRPLTSNVRLLSTSRPCALKSPSTSMALPLPVSATAPAALPLS